MVPIKILIVAKQGIGFVVMALQRVETMTRSAKKWGAEAPLLVLS